MVEYGCLLISVKGYICKSMSGIYGVFAVMLLNKIPVLDKGYVTLIDSCNTTETGILFSNITANTP